MTGLPQLDGALVVANGDEGLARHTKLRVGDPPEDETGVLIFAEDRVLESDFDPRESGVQRPAFEIRGSIVLNIGVGAHDFPMVRLHFSKPGGVVWKVDPGRPTLALSPVHDVGDDRGHSGLGRPVVLGA